MGRVAVIGSGLTGLGAAWRLERAGHLVTVYEGSSEVGGNIRSIASDGFLVEEGPNTIQLANAEHEDWLNQVGMGPSIQDSDPGAAKRYLVRGGRPHAAPSSPAGFLGTPLFSWKAKLRLAREPFARRGPPAGDESLSAFVLRRLGREMLDYAITPFVGGVYAGDPDRLSVRHGFPKLFRLEQNHRSLILGSIALRRRRKREGTLYKTRLISFEGGLQSLPRKLAASLSQPVRLSTPVSEISCDRGWSVRCGNLNEPENYDAVILALPATALAGIVINETTALSELDQIRHPPVISYAMGFRRDQVAHPLDGFGALIPALEPFRILGTLFSSSLFAGRAPDDHVLLTSFIGGTREPELTRLPEDQLRTTVLADLSRLLGVHGEPVFEHKRLWPRAIPQYEVGYGRHIDLIRTIETKYPGLFIGGNACDGISLSYCLEAGRRLAREADGRLMR